MLAHLVQLLSKRNGAGIGWRLPVVSRMDMARRPMGCWLEMML